MHKNKHYQKFRHFYPNRNPSEIEKDILPFDSCSVFPYRREYWCQARSTWVDRLSKQDLSGLCREDPFGINNYHLGFSLNKKKRWTIPDEIGERIEELQDPRLNLRVSAFVRDIDRCNWRLNRFVDAMDYLGCTQFHTVSRDGSTVTHRESSGHKTRVRSYTHPAPQAPRKVKGEPRRPRYRESKDSEGFDLPYNDNLQCQLLHVSYTITVYSDSASQHNKASQKSPFCFPRKLSKKYSNIIKVEDEDDYESEDEDVVEHAVPPLEVDISSLVVRREKRKRKTSRVREGEDDGFVVV